MAAASYTTDLTLLHATDAASASWSEPTGFAGGAITLPETDYYIQNTGCLSKNCGTGTPIGVGAIYNAGAGQTIPTDGAFLAWVFFGAPNALSSEAAGGIQLFIGSAGTAFKQWYLKGSDTYPYGGWVNLAVDPTITADATTGTPTATLQYFGAGVYIPGPAIPSKGNPFGLDVIRFGRCEARINGGDLANGYATFAGYATQNDAVANRWGLIQAVGGGYLWKGLMTLGYVSAVDFRDSNTSVLIDNTKKVSANFNKIEIRQATSRVDWTNISFLALGTVSRGNIEVIDDADVNITGCTFTDMGTVIFKSQSTIISSTFRRCDLITQNSAVLTSCIVDSSFNTSAALLSNNPGAITYCEFLSDGTGHAVQCNTVGTYGWVGNLDTGYTGTRGSNLTPNSGSTDAMFYNNSGGLITLNVSGGGQSPSVRNGAGATTVVNNVVIYTVAGVETNSEVRIYNAQTDTLLDGIENTTGQVKVVAINSGGTGYTVGNTLTVVGGTGTAATLTVTTVSGGVITGVTIATPGSYSVNPTNPVSVTGGSGSNATFFLTISGSFAYSYSYSGDIPIYVVVFNTNYKDVRLVNRTLTNTNQTDTVQMIYDRVYSNPA